MTRAANLDPKTLARRLTSRKDVKRARQTARSKKSSDGWPAAEGTGKARRKSTSGKKGAVQSPAGPRSPAAGRLTPKGRGRASGTSGSPRFPSRPAFSLRRRREVEVGLSLMALLLLGRAVQLQLVDGHRYGSAAARQASAEWAVRAERGVIMDRDREPLAISVDVDSVFAEPRRIQDPAATARRLAPVLELPVERIRQRLVKDGSFAYLVRRVDPAVGARVRALGLAGIGTHPEPKRFYANTDLAAHVLGFVNIEGVGQTGVEKTFDQVLRGRSLSIAALRDGIGNRALTDGFVPPSELAGKGVVLTLDRQVQDAAQSELLEAVQSHGAKAGVALVMDVRSGDLLALASVPHFNPNNLENLDSRSQLNRAISAVYEPGSTMKVVTLAAALEEGVFSEHDQLDCEDGRWKFGGRTIRDGHHKYGTLSLTDVLRVSSNICTAKVGVELGRARLHRWLQKFGLDTPTGVELPGELDGLVRDPKTWSDIGLANIAFGQGLAVTPIQLLRAIAVVASDGMLVAPRVVKGVVDGDKVRPVERPEPSRVISVRTARTLRRMMETVVQSGTAQRAAIEGVRIAGKTGTAQKVDPQTRRYADDRYVASFVGIAPADEPKFVGLVLLDEPARNHHGGVAAAPAFRRIMTVALHTQGQVVQSDPAPAGPPVRRPSSLAPSSAPDPAGSGSDPVLAEGSLSAQARRLLGLEVPGPETSAGERKSMPDLTGLELREVLKRCRKARCSPVIRGTGRVVRQSPEPGEVTGPGEAWELTLRSR